MGVGVGRVTGHEAETRLCAISAPMKDCTSMWIAQRFVRDERYTIIMHARCYSMIFTRELSRLDPGKYLAYL